MSTNDAEATDSNSESDSNDSDSQNDYYYDDGDENEMNLGNSGQFIEDSESNEENGQDIDEEKLLAELEDRSVIDNNEQAVERETLIVANENYIAEADGENNNMQASSAENAEMVENVAEHDSGNENAVDTQSFANEQNAQHVFETATDISEQNTNMENANLSQAVNPAVANALDTPAPNEESSGDVGTPVKPADANVQQGGGSGTPVNLADANVQQGGGSGTPVNLADANVQQGGGSGTPVNLADANVQQGGGSGTPVNLADANVQQGGGSGTPVNLADANAQQGGGSGTPVNLADVNVQQGGGSGTPVNLADANVQQGGGSGTPVNLADANVQQGGGSGTPVNLADANVQQGGGSGTPVNLAVPHVSTTKKPPKRKTTQEPEGEKNARLAWKDRGKVIFRHPWEICSAPYIDGLVKGVQRLKGDLYCKWTKTGFERLSQTTFTVSDNKTKDDPDLGFLHLKNVDNDIAAAIREHLEVSYDSTVVQVQKIFLMLFNTCLI